MSRRFYSNRRQTEPDMRQEFENTMDGMYPEIAKAQQVILRKMKRVAADPIIIDPNSTDYDAALIRRFHSKDQVPDYYVPEEGYLLFCPCINTITNEADLDTFCPVCQGERYIWEETFIEVYKVVLQSDVGKAVRDYLIQPGLTNIPLVIFYTRSSVPITRADKVVEVWTDEEGEPMRPYRRKALYVIGTTLEMRSDSGRLEYLKLDCREEQRKYLNGPRVG